jgi:hypothetical protein
MSFPKILTTILLLVLIPVKTIARDGLTIWDSRCEECHSNPVDFAGKFLWNIDGELQGQHHIDDLALFMANHYIPDHEIKTIREMLLSYANSPRRFKTECGECHGDAVAFVEKSIWVRGNEITGMGTGKSAKEFLPGHKGVKIEDVLFYRKLFARIAGKPLREESSEELIIKFP